MLALNGDIIHSLNTANRLHAHRPQRPLPPANPLPGLQSLRDYPLLAVLVEEGMRACGLDRLATAVHVLENQLVYVVGKVTYRRKHNRSAAGSGRRVGRRVGSAAGSGLRFVLCLVKYKT